MNAYDIKQTVRNYEDLYMQLLQRNGLFGKAPGRSKL
jgi:hypothetical protein